MRFISVIFILTLALSFYNCKKDTKIEPDPTPNNPPPVVTDTSTGFSIHLDAVFNGRDLVFNDKKLYRNEAGDSLNVNTFNYYFTNIVLTNTSGVTFSENESYHLVMHDKPERTSFLIKDLPEGTYNKLNFIIGVDPKRNVSGAQTGDLDPIYNMFWEWNTGYIFFKLEGQYKSLATPTVFVGYGWHVGGDGMSPNPQASYTLNLTQPLVITKGKKPQLHLNVIMDELFRNPKKIYLDTITAFAGGPESKIVAKNYEDMITFKSVIN